MTNCAAAAFVGGAYFLPFTSIVQVGPSFSLKTRGRIEAILPSLTWTKTGPPIVQLVNIWPVILHPPSPLHHLYDTARAISIPTIMARGNFQNICMQQMTLLSGLF